MSEWTNVEERLEAMATRLECVEREPSDEAMGFDNDRSPHSAGPFASSVMAKKTKEPKALTASAFNLKSNGVVVASLGVFNGYPTRFLDNSGKQVMGVGVDGAATYREVTGRHYRL